MSGEIVCSFAALDVLGEALRINLRRFPFAIPHHGTTREDRVRLIEAVHRDLIDRGLVRDGEFAPESVQALHVFARGHLAVALVGTADETQPVALAVTDDRTGVIAEQQDNAIAFRLCQPDAVRIAATVERQARSEHRAEPEPVSFQSWSGMPDLETWLTQVKVEQAAIGRQLREARENADKVSLQVTTLRSPYGLVTLQIRNRALVGLTADAAAVSRANVGQLQQDLWEVFSDAGLTSDRGITPASPSKRRLRAEEADPEEDVWKGLGAQ
nr:ESX secretion-associated protein EspG [Lentzea kentuckyensis]